MKNDNSPPEIVLLPIIILVVAIIAVYILGIYYLTCLGFIAFACIASALPFALWVILFLAFK